MLKFAKYFFIVFFITAIVPLVLMFYLTNRQMEKAHSYMDQNIMKVGKSKILSSLDNILKVQEGDIFKRLYLVDEENLDVKEIKKILKDYEVEPVVTKYKEPVSFYENKNLCLYSSSVIPFKSSDKGIKVSKPVNLNLLRPAGPYDMGLSFSKDTKKLVMTHVLRDPMAPPFPPEIKKPLFNIVPVRHEISNNHEQTLIAIKNDKDDTIGYLMLYFGQRPHKPIQDSMNISLIILFVGIVSSFIIGLLIKKVFVKPVMALSKAAKEIKNGNLEFRLSVSNQHSIIKNIYNNFNEMSKNLATKEELRQSFISNLTHDLRTPLVSQAQSLEMISKKFKEIGLQNEYELAESLAKNNEHLLKMVNLILESYCFDPSKLSLTITKTDLSDIADDCESKLKPLIESKNIKFINDIYKGSTLIEADVFQLTRVFMNILSNSIENIKENDFIRVSARYDDKKAIVTIEDNGNGISPEDLKFIFDRYYSGKSLERKLGSGFGLSVCQKLVNLHGGKIFAESEVNKYTKFIIELPLNQPERKN